MIKNVEAAVEEVQSFFQHGKVGGSIVGDRGDFVIKFPEPFEKLPTVTVTVSMDIVTDFLSVHLLTPTLTVNGVSGRVSRQGNVSCQYVINWIAVGF